MDSKRLVEISPLIGSFLIFVGFLKLFCYYNHWDINIINYLDFSEIILSFLNDLNILLFFTLVMAVQGTVGFATIATIDRRINKSTTPAIENVPNDNTETLNQTPEPSKFRGVVPLIDEILEKHYGWMMGLSFIAFAITSFLFICFVNLPLMYLSYVFAFQLIVPFLDKIMGITNLNSQIQATFVILIIGFTLTISWYEIKQVETHPRKVEVYFEKDSFSTSDKVFFIGKTSNYYFFFDKENRQTIVYATSTVQKVCQTPE